jgi:hypothetical protein
VAGAGSATTPATARRRWPVASTRSAATGPAFTMGYLGVNTRVSVLDVVPPASYCR